MKKTFITVATIGVVGFGSAIFGNAVQAETISDIQNQRTEVKDNLSEADAKITDVLFDLEEINEQITRVENTLKDNKDKMEDTKIHIGKTNDEIEDLEDEITDLENDIEKRYEILKKRAISYQKNGGDVGFLEVVLGSNNFSELVSRVSAVSKITESDEELMNKQEEDKEKVEKKQTKAEEKLTDLKEMKAELEGMQDTILAQKDEKESSKKNLKKKEKELKEMKAELEVKDSKLASLEADVRADVEAARQAREEQLTASSSNTSSNNSSSDGELTTLSQKQPTNFSTGNGNVSGVINVGKQFIGHSTYLWGAKSPSTGQFDCSGFVSWAYEQEGYSLPRSTAGLSSTGTQVSSSNMQPGDLVFFDTEGRKNGHVGIYMGNGQFIGSQSTTGVGIASMNNTYWSNAFKGHVRRVK